MSLSGPDGRVLGGSVAGLLTAASPVQVRSILFFYSFVKEICMMPNVLFLVHSCYLVLQIEANCQVPKPSISIETMKSLEEPYIRLPCVLLE